MLSPRQVYRTVIPSQMRNLVRRIVQAGKDHLVALRNLILFPVALLLKRRGIRSVRTGAGTRIGHLVGECLMALAWMMDGEVNARRILAPFGGKSACNAVVAGRLNPDFFITSFRGCPHRLVRWLADHPVLYLPTLRDFVAMPSPIFGLDPSRYPTLLTAQANDDTEFRLLMKQLKLDYTKPYACLHVRSEGYSPVDDAVQSHRNADLSTYREAIQLLTEAGYQVVRVGGPYGQRLAESEAVRDYAFSSARSDLRDYLLATKCAFFIGNTSGLYALAATADRPVLGINMSPINAFGLVGRRTMSIPKLGFSKARSRLVGISEYAFAPRGNALAVPENTFDGDLEVVANTCQEVRLAVQDLLSIVDQPLWELTPEEDQLQKEFRAALPEDAYSIFSGTLVAPSFLELHRDLL